LGIARGRVGHGGVPSDTQNVLRIRLQHARPGMELALPVHHPRSTDMVLLRAGVALDSLSIPHLMELGVADVYIRYPGLERLMRFVDPEMLSQQRSLVRTLGTALDQAFLSNSVEVDFYACRRSLNAMIRRLLEVRDSAVWLGQLAGANQPFVRHCSSVTYLSLLMGMRLDFYLVRERPRLPAGRAKDLTSLGMGALFHDIGMLRLAPDVLERYHTTLDESDPAWRAHCAMGLDMVHGKLDPAAAAIVLHHHQRWDGGGFPCRASFREEPRPPKEREIHVLSRIVAAAEMLSRLQHPAHAPQPRAEPRSETTPASKPAPVSRASDGPSLPTVRALRRMLDPARRAQIDPVVFRALFSVTPPYPPGSVVTLSDGSQAVVTAWTPKHPCRPTVELIDLAAPTRRRRKKPVVIDLREHTSLSVAAIDGERTLEDNFEPSVEDEFDISGLFRGISTGQDTKQDTKQDAKQDAKPEAIPETRLETRLESRLESRPELKSQSALNAGRGTEAPADDDIILDDEREAA
jgi:HD-GYP domain-containing protein (c-di-GMP phosphodiesterase class II)